MNKTKGSMERECIIYCIRNTENDFRYVGCTYNYVKRKSKHLNDLLQNNHHSNALQLDWNKNGENVFVFEIIVKRIATDRNHKFSIEQSFLDDLCPEYNSYKTAGSALGFKHTNETKQKMSTSGTGKKLSKDHREKIRVAKLNLSDKGRKNLSIALKGNKNCLGNIVSEETKRKISQANSNPSPETRERLRAAMLGKKLSDETKNKIGLIHRGKPWSENRRLAQNKKG